MNKTRLFSIPYNGSNIDEYIKKIDAYKLNVHSVFLALPGIGNHFSSVKNVQDSNYDEKCGQFLRETDDTGIERLVTINSCYDTKYIDEIEELANRICEKLIKYNVDGIICTNYYLAFLIRQQMPNLKISTSCNCFQNSIREMQNWDNMIGVDLFNPPRSAARNIPMLKDMHEHGFKLKVLINEQCTIGCPEEISHFIQLSTGNMAKHDCLRGNLSNTLRSCWVIPRWLDVLDEYVDVYKITGRLNQDTDKIFRLIDLYSMSEDCLLSEIGQYFGQNKTIYTDIIPDKLLYCGCKNCKTCNVCDDLAHKIFDK